MDRVEPMKKYDAVHKELRRTRGPARLLLCVQCGEQALDWALRRDLDAAGISHSDDLDDYYPLCRRCHVFHDIPAEQLRARGRRQVGNTILADRLRDDAEFAERWRGVASDAGKVGGKAVSRLRRRCVDCSMTTNPGSMKRHLVASGHGGYEIIQEGEL